MDRTLHDHWLQGLELSFAWRMVPSDDLQAQYRESGDNFAHRESVISAMQRELRERLLSGEFHAIGVVVSPQAVPSLGRVPAHLFVRPEAVDWDGSSVRAHGTFYDDIRVIGMPNGFMQDTTAPDSEVVLGEEKNIQPSRMGRPSVVPLLCDLINLMRSEGALAAMQQKERIERVRERARTTYPDLFPGTNQPARTTIIRALKLAGY